MRVRYVILLRLICGFAVFVEGLLGLRVGRGGGRGGALGFGGGGGGEWKIERDGWG